MSKRSFALILWCVLLPAFCQVTRLAAAGSDVAAGPPAGVFSELDFEAAKAKAVTEQKLLLVDAMASWCGPCHKMDEVTWTDPGVRAWLASHAVAIRFDVDQDPDLARHLKIEAMPTLIAFRDGKEFERNVGFQKPGDLLPWLDGVGRGERRQKVLEDRLEKVKGQGPEEVKARLDLAQAAADSGDLDRAASEYAWLWDNSLNADPSFVGVRSSFMADDMRNLAEKASGPREVFRQLRERLSPLVVGLTCDRHQFADWMTLCRVLGEETLILSWFSQIKAEPRAASLLKLVGEDLADLLAEQGRWAEAGSLLADPLAEVKSTLAMSKSMEKEPDYFDMVLSSVGPRYAMLLAAGREEEGKAVASEVVGVLGSDLNIRLTLVRFALEASATIPIHGEWLAEAASAGMEVMDLQERRAIVEPSPLLPKD